MGPPMGRRGRPGNVRIGKGKGSKSGKKRR
jgi:hypothetical protein